jgi:glycogen synthase
MLWVHRGKFGGVLNGVDYDAWNPEVDPFIARRYARGYPANLLVVFLLVTL